MSETFEYTFNKNIRDTYQLELFLYKNNFRKILSINTNEQNSELKIMYEDELSESQITNLENLILNVYTNPYPNNENNSVVSLINTTSIPLTAYQVYNGEYEDISNFTSITILISSDASSIKNGIEITFSTDGITEQYKKIYTYTKNQPFVEILTSITKYYKIVYKNGGTNQTKFTIQSMYNMYKHPNIHSTTQNNLIKIDEESNKSTKGRFRTQGFFLDISADSTDTHDFTFDYDIAPLVIKFKTNESQRGDVINLFIAPNTTIGVLTQNTIPSTNFFYVTPNSFDWLSIGCLCRITDGIISNYLGDVIDIDYTTCKVTVKNNITDTFTAGKFVQMTVQIMKNYIISEPGDHCIGDSKIGASYIPKNQIIRVEYTNNSSEPKRFVWNTEMLY